MYNSNIFLVKIKHTTNFKKALYVTVIAHIIYLTWATSRNRVPLCWVLYLYMTTVVQKEIKQIKGQQALLKTGKWSYGPLLYSDMVIPRGFISTAFNSG